MPTSVNDAGTWRTLQDVYVNDAGTWRRIQEVWVNESGTWRLVHVGDVISIDNTPVSDSQISPTPAIVSYALLNTGVVQASSAGVPFDVGNWVTPTSSAGAAYEARATVISGSPAGTFGTWQALNANRSWSLSRSAVGTSSASFTVEIRRASDGTVLDSATITLEAQVS